MFQIPCLNGHDETVDFFCLAENCKDIRFCCFNRCIKSGLKHAHNDKDLYKIEKFPNYLHKSNIQFSELIQHLDKIFEDLISIYKQLRQQLYYTFEWTLDRIKWLKGKNINIALDNIIKLEEYKRRVIINLKQNAQKLSQTLNQSIQELQLKEKVTQQFYLLKQCQIKEKEAFNTIASNYDSSIIICGFQSCIKIYEFRNQSIQEIQIIKQECTIKLLFINDTDKFISQFDHSVDIFSKINTNWQKQQSIDFVDNEQLYIMKDESILIIGWIGILKSFLGQKKVVKCFQKIKEQYQLQDEYQIDLQHYLCINSDMNDSENTIIWCSDQMIEIIQRQCQTKKWDTLQKIQIQEASPQGKFIQNDSFIVSKHSLLCIYSRNSNNKLFEKKREITLSQSQSQSGRIISNNIEIKQFFKSKQFLVITINSKFSIYKFDENGDLRIEYDVECANCQGVISKNGRILVTQDLNSKQISIRQILE
ncbi:unnamed protein product [Paramecium octaurelia]|uniref:Uncharacterized protein n=1 Tax=Paramecium octaurelia TaxID=43137 RepID=A0A8S1THR9_PAROT|nr:unnamed protein product [Paramecium octaurelia]